MDWKKAVRKILYPHPVFVAVLALLAAGTLAYSFIRLDSSHIFSVISYVLSFCALMLLCLRVPDMIRWIQRFQNENRYYLRYATDVRLKVNISLYSGFAFGAVYALFQLCLGLWHRSVWFYAMALYYLLLAGMRLLLLRHTRSHAPGEQQSVEWKKYRLCGVMLLMMNFALAVILAYFLYRIRVFSHHEITTIAMAAYTFTSLSLAILNVVRFRKFGSPAYSAAKAISLVSASVSMLTLENAMLTAFGQDSGETFRQIMLGTTGAAVILFVQIVAIYMMVNATRNLKVNNSQT